MSSSDLRKRKSKSRKWLNRKQDSLPLHASDSVVPVWRKQLQSLGYNYSSTEVLEGVDVPEYKEELQLEALLGHQVAGSSPFLKAVQPSGVVCKLALPREVWFYARVREAYPHYQPFMPKFLGCVELAKELVRSAQLSHNETDSPWARHMREGMGRHADERRAASTTAATSRYLVLEDLTFGYEKPCILDMKVCTRAYGDDATPAKMRSQMKKTLETTSSTLGLRLGGMQVHHGEEGYQYMHKYAGRALTEESLPLAIEAFFSNGSELRLDVIEVMLRLLHNLQEATKGEEFKLYCSSLLFIYEGDQTLTVARKPRVKMIDFAHTFERRKDEKNDDGYQFGLANFIGFVQELADRDTEEEEEEEEEAEMEAGAEEHQRELETSGIEASEEKDSASG